MSYGNLVCRYAKLAVIIQF